MKLAGEYGGRSLHCWASACGRPANISQPEECNPLGWSGRADNSLLVTARTPQNVVHYPWREPAKRLKVIPVTVERQLYRPYPREEEPLPYSLSAMAIDSDALYR